jgi:tRNA A37 methylthiotransferase MiaB
VPENKESPLTADRRVRLVTLGCARNEVDSEELAGRLETAGWGLTDGADADVVVVNTCGFIEAAKQESIDELLEATSSGAKVIAAGCLAERYGSDLAEALPEAQIVSFDDYPEIAARLDAVAAGERWAAHTPRDRRRLLPLAPAARPGARPGTAPAGLRSDGIPDLPAGLAPASGPRVPRRRLGKGVTAPLKIASGCDRRCSFCAIPSFRGAFLSRPAGDLVEEARWLAGQGVRELLLVSENSTSYGKDLGNLRLLEELLPALAAVDGIAVVRVSYLQPAELRPGLIDVLASTPGVAPYFDLSFQHASGPVLRAMRRFGDAERFTDLVGRIPGETEDDLDTLQGFLDDARLDAIGIFGYSDEDGTEAASLPGKVDPAEVARRVEEVTSLADELMAQRSADRVGEVSDVLLERRLGPDQFEGRAAHQAPEVDGVTVVRGCGGGRPGDLVRAEFAAAEGVDLQADAVETASPVAR